MESTTLGTAARAASMALLLAGLAIACGDELGPVPGPTNGASAESDAGQTPDSSVGSDAGADTGSAADDAAVGGGDAADSGPADAGAGSDAAPTDGGAQDTGPDQSSSTDAGGGTDTTSPDPCGTTTFEYAAGTETVDSAILAGSFNGWAPEEAAGGWPLTDDDGDNVWTTTRLLDPGTYEYKFVINGDWRHDPLNPETADDGYGGLNSVLVVECGGGEAHLEVLSHASDDLTGQIAATVRLWPDDAPLDPARLEVTLNHQPVATDELSVSGNDISVDVSGLPSGIYDLRVSAATVEGSAAGPILLKYHVGVSTDWADDVIYFAMTDRFRNGDPGNDAPVPDVDWRVNWQGGDFEGIRQAIDEGYFDGLGVGALWISWPIDNFDGYQTGGRPAEHRCGLNPGTMATEETRYTAYHGYWPRDVEAVDPHFGTREELLSLVDAAHARGIRVLLDFTANHVHTSAPLFEAHRHEYFNWPDTGYEHICQNVGWDNEPESCWFTEYLADFDYRSQAAVNAVVDNAVDWIVETGADGFRVDAVKHINRNFLRALRSRVERDVELTGIPFYLVGETFTGDAGLIASFVGDDLIHGQFDFPLNHQVLQAFATQSIGLDELDRNARGIKASYGGALMSNFIGNHDIARFVSLAAGDIYCGPWDVVSNIAQGWLDPPDAPDSADPHQRLRLALTYIMTIPGVPLIYYGDEMGMPGAGDPDNRRMMRFGDDLGWHEGETLGFVQRLGTARAEHPALRTGSWEAPLWSERDLLAYPRKHADETVIVILNRGGGDRELSLGVGALGIADGEVFEDALSASPESRTVSGGQLSVTVPGQSAVILAPR